MRLSFKNKENAPALARSEVRSGDPLIQQCAMDRGLLIRAAPDAIYICPPLIITRAQIDEMMDALSAALDNGYAVAVRRGLVGEEERVRGE